MLNKETIIINRISDVPSLCDGPGYRTVLYLQGCSLKCPGCHNSELWNIKKGKSVYIDDLVNEIKNICKNKKLTISGGEPLLQKDSVLSLLSKLKDFDICLYTGMNYEDVPKKILKYLKYIKYGRYDSCLRTTITPYVGSSNQIFMEVKQ